MSTITAIINGETIKIEIPCGTRLLDALDAAHVLLPPSDCGGRGSCKKCRVKLLRGKADTDPDGYFLSCRHIVTEDISISYEVCNGAGLTDSRHADVSFRPRPGYGIAADIGTTTLAVYLVDLNDGKVIGAASEANAQKLYGGDVISRIKAASEGHTDDLHRRIIDQCDRIIHGLLSEHQIPGAEEACIAGNTTMQHLFAGINPEPMGVFPFSPVFTETKRFSAVELGLSDIASVTLLPSASAFIGADVLAGIVSSGMLKHENAILADIGTNCEIILKCGNSFFAAAAAAGPAFEGAGIEMGMPGVAHAINKVFLHNGRVEYTTIGCSNGLPSHSQPSEAVHTSAFSDKNAGAQRSEAKGICGSGLADAVAVMLDLGILDKSGAFAQKSPYHTGDKFYLSSKVYVSQKDVRAYQLAKSAVCSGIQKLINVSGLCPEDIEKLYIAGGFGYYLEQSSAAKTGLIPPALASRSIAAGNTSGLGARMCLLNPAYLSECERLAKEIRIVELAGDPYFTAALMDNMLFGDF